MTDEHTLTGEFRLHETFASRHLEHPRTLVVYLPPGYDHEPDRRYPVLYLHDGQNVFDKATSVGEEWRVDETATAMIERGEIAPLIIVGIYNTGEHRIEEYTPSRDAKHQSGGKADAYGLMMVEEIKPHIDGQYRTLPGASTTAMAGSSLGGLLTLHVGLRHSAVFGHLACLSPSVWWDDRVIVREVRELPGKLPLRIWLDAGTNEGPEVTADARMLRDALLERGWKEGEDLRYLEVEGGSHDEHSWAARVDPFLRFLFPAGK